MLSVDKTPTLRAIWIGLRTSVISWCALFIAITPSQAEPRVALVIGNSAYEHQQPLVNPGNDAKSIAYMLQQPTYGFTLHGGSALLDLKTKEMRSELLAFASEAAKADIALIYYAGHGFSFGTDYVSSQRAETYLVPVNAKLEFATSLPSETVTLSDFLAATSGARHASVIILDSCRDNAFRLQLLQASTNDGKIRGMARPLSIPSGRLVAYAASEGEVASDGVGGHSPYTSALLQELPIPQRGVRATLAAVQNKVYLMTKGAQTPTFTEKFDTGDFSLVLQSKPLQNRIQSFIVFFTYASINLTAEANDVLTDVVSAFRAGRYKFIKVRGRTDTYNSAAYSLQVSRGYAEAVKSNLVSKGVLEQQIITEGIGETDPFIQTGDGVREPQNRNATIDLIE